VNWFWAFCNFQVQFLSLVGGRTADKNTRKILGRIFSHDLSRRINFTGKGEKTALKHLTILSVVIGKKVSKYFKYIYAFICNKISNNSFIIDYSDAVRQNHSTATDDLIEKTAINWFRFSKDREGGRNQRSQNNNNQQ